MTERHDLDEYLEHLWHMKEEGVNSVDSLKKQIGTKYDDKLLDTLQIDGLVETGSQGAKVALTQEGEHAAQLLIRSHRLAETLIYTVSGRLFEPLACEFEHMVIPEIVDSICTLLAHPKECPHGKPIPRGDCCKHAVIPGESLIIPLTHLKVGQSSRVAYVNYNNDQQFHKIESLNISRGVTVKLLQIFPAYVIDCEGVNIVCDDEIASQIFVWKVFCPKVNNKEMDALAER